MTYEPQYGEVKVYMKSWGFDVAGTVWRELEMRPCNPEELGLGPQGFSDPSSKFYPINEDN